MKEYQEKPGETERIKVLDIEEAKSKVTEWGPSIKYDTTREPVFPPNREDVAIIQRDAEDGETYGRTVWYVAFNKGEGTEIRTFHDTGRTHDNYHIDSVDIEDGILMLKTNRGDFTMKLSDLGLES